MLLYYYYFFYQQQQTDKQTELEKSVTIDYGNVLSQSHCLYQLVLVCCLPCHN